MYKACWGAVTYTVCSEKFCVLNTVITIEIHAFGSFAWGRWSCQHFARVQVSHVNMTNRKLLLKVTSVSSALFTDFISSQKFPEISLFPLHIQSAGINNHTEDYFAKYMHYITYHYIYFFLKLLVMFDYLMHIWISLSWNQTATVCLKNLHILAMIWNRKINV